MTIYLKLPLISGITLWPVIFIDPKYKGNKELKNHEKIHYRQFMDLMILSFTLQTITYFGFGWYEFWINFLIGYFARFIWYLIEFMVRWIWLIRNNFKFPKEDRDTIWFLWDVAYFNISMEREAYQMDSDLDYLNKRKPFAHLKYLKQ